MLASAQNLTDLLALFKALKDNHEAGCEALRCLANTLLLVEGARLTLIEDAVDGGEVALQLLEVRRVILYLQMACPDRDASGYC